MKLFVAFVRYVEQAFDPQFHSIPDTEFTPDNGVFSVQIEEAEGQIATVVIERVQEGLSFLKPNSLKHALISISATGRWQDAKLIARARLDEVPDCLGETQTLRYVCAPLGISRELLTWAKANLNETPYVDTLFSDFDPEVAESYLLARSASYHVHPATWGIGLIDDLEGERVLDMREASMVEDENGRTTSSQVSPYGAPLAKVFAKITVEWEQNNTGEVDVARFIPAFSTLDPDVGPNFESYVDFLPAEGWTMLETKAEVREGLFSGWVPGATRYKSTTKTYSVNDAAPEVLEQEHSLSVSLRQYSARVRRMIMGYETSTPRREEMAFEVACPVLATGIERIEDPLEFSLNDVFDEADIRFWEPGKHKANEIVLYNGRTYRSIGDHEAQSFYQPSGQTKLVETGISGVKTDLPVGWWEPVEANDVDWVRPDMPSFWRTIRAARVRQHALLRCVKEGRRRMRLFTVTLRFAWEHAAHVTMRDAIRFDVYEGNGQFRAVVGKVVGIRKSWTGDGPAVIEIEAAVSLGDGSAVEDQTSYFPKGYADPSYSVPGATLNGLFAAPTVTWDDLRQPYGFANIRSNLRVVDSVVVKNEAFMQMWAAQRIGSRGGDVRQASVELPTTVQIAMPPMPSKPLMESRHVTKTAFAGGPQGISL